MFFITRADTFSLRSVIIPYKGIKYVDMPKYTDNFRLGIGMSVVSCCISAYARFGASSSGGNFVNYSGVVVYDVFFITRTSILSLRSVTIPYKGIKYVDMTKYADDLSLGIGMSVVSCCISAYTRFSTSSSGGNFVSYSGVVVYDVFIVTRADILSLRSVTIPYKGIKYISMSKYR